MATLTSPSLTKLLTDVRVILNQQDSSNSFWSDAELTTYINDAVSQYFLEIEERAEGQFDTTSTISLIANQDTYALPSDFFKIRVLYKVTPTCVIPLRYLNNLDMGYSTLPTNTGQYYQPYYYFQGNSIVLRDPPSADETASSTGGLKLEYTAFPDRIIWGGDSLTNRISPVFKELIVMYAVVKAKIKEDLTLGGNNSDKASQHLAKIEKKFIETLGPRSNFPQFVKPFNP